jgi:hypothetical protein
MDEVLADILNTCLQQLKAGLSVEECLAAYPQQRAMLEAPLRAAQRLRGLPQLTLPTSAQAALETRMLVQAAQRRMAPAQPPVLNSRVPLPPAATLGPAALFAGVLRALGYRGPLTLPWLRLASTAIALLLVLVLGAGALAATRAIVRIIQGSTASPTSTPTAPVRFTLDGPIEQITPERWVVRGTSIAIGAQTTISGTPTLGARAQISGAVQADGTRLAQTIAIAASLMPSQLPVPTVPPSPIVVATNTPTPKPTATPTNTPTPKPTATSLPAGTTVNISGVIQHISITNNVTTIVVNEITYVLPPNLVVSVGERLRSGVPIVFVAQVNAAGQIVIINVVEINHQRIIINPPRNGGDDDNDDDDGDDDDDD